MPQSSTLDGAPCSGRKNHLQTRDEQTFKAHHEPLKVLIVDEMPVLADTLGEILTRSGFHVIVTYNSEEGLAQALHFRPDCLITDLLAPGAAELPFAVRLKELDPGIRIVVFSGSLGFLTAHQTEQFRSLGFELIEKPIHPADLVKRISGLTRS